jgi:phosphoenolpyruvate-protein kinase (PTS system EI component)
MTEQVLSGIPASPGAAAGLARLLEPPPSTRSDPVPAAGRPAEADLAAGGLRHAATELEELAGRLRREGREAEAEIVETGALMATDPMLHEAVSAATLERGLTAPAALIEATDSHADLIAAVDDPMLAARADDVRSLGRRAARLASGNPGDAGPADGEAVLVARDLGPADVAELRPEVRGIALAAGGVTAHAAIVARSLGLPMAVGLGEELLRVAPGSSLVVDGSEGVAVLEPTAGRREAAEAAAAGRTRARAQARADSALPAVTRDGHRMRVLVNAATAAEAGTGLDAGAEGAGLIRTELSFLEAGAWPSEEEHRRALTPVLAPLGRELATVRVLDFGGDKTPPFLQGTRARGIDLLLEHPDALSAQLRAILTAAGESELRVLLPMASSGAQLAAVRGLLRDALARVAGARSPALGAMVETPEAAANAGELASAADFLSIGTNDLTAATLGVDRFSSGQASAHDPSVLRLIANVVRAARSEGVPVEVCGEAASDPLGVPILVGLGVDELSVGAVRVGTVRAWVRALALSDCEQLAARALEFDGADQVEREGRDLSSALELAERGDAAGESVERGGGVLPIGPQP